MRKSIFIGVLLSLFLACSEKEDKTTLPEEKEKINAFLPFTTIELDSMSSFGDVSKNWKIVGDVYVDRTKEKTLVSAEGNGILINLPNDTVNGPLVTNFEHGDMELEIDVMMPKGSNSGLYFQGRYEVQLLDSWGVKEPQFSDMGAIYQRWDDARGKDKEGYEGHSPIINAAKAPGLWQHFKIIFHAPRFNESGKKIKNAEFEEVWLNGALVQKNVEVTGPTRAAAFEDEVSKGPLMIQGDHGPVALKQIKYKLYDDDKVSFGDMTLNEYESEAALLTNLDSLKPLRTIKTDSISAAMVSGKNPHKILSYTGSLIIPETGDYLFEYRINEGGGLLIIENDTVINLDGDYKLEELGLGKKRLEAGNVPFQLIYNKHRYWKQGFSLEVEGPGIEKHVLHKPSSLNRTSFNRDDVIMIDVADDVEFQRGFWLHDGEKRTHCMAVGTPEGEHYAYDLSAGALLQVWSGDFFDATDMWWDRGEKQLGKPAGFTVSFHGNPDFVTLSDKTSKWPKDAAEFEDFKSLGFTLDSEGLPTFNFLKGNTAISDKMIPSKENRSFTRTITFDGETAIIHKIAQGEHINELPDGTFIINDESYFINFPKDAALKPEIRSSNGNEELILNIPGGEHTLSYSITW